MKTKHPITRWIVARFVKNTRDAWFRRSCFTSNYQRHITPSLTCVPWHRSCLATISELGITTHSGSVGIEFWCWSWSLTFGVSQQSPEDAAKMACNRQR